MGYTENKILLAKVWQKPNTYQLNCGSQTLAWQSVARNQTGPKFNPYHLPPDARWMESGTEPREVAIE
jgi:hypothetical protein